MKRRDTVLLSLLWVAACAKGAPRDAVAPEASAAPGGDFGMADGYTGESAAAERDYASEPPTFDELEARFEQLDADLSAQGISGSEETSMTTSPTPDAAGTPADEGKDSGKGSRCERICKLKDAICDVSERICGLAESHEDETKYTDACTRSETRCEQATTACSTCSG